MKKNLTLALVASLSLGSALSAAEFAPVFTDNAVLQRDEPVAVWGTGRDGEQVTVELNGKSASATVADGKWRVELAAMPAAENGTLVLKGDNEVRLNNIAVGEVWIGSGQSNMEWRLSGCAPLYDTLIASANDSGIRELKIPLRTHTGEPLGKLQWKTFEKGTAGQFGAVAYFFAAELRRKLGVVVGIVNCSFGGTRIEAWMSRDAITAAGSKDILDDADRRAAAFATPEEYEKAWSEYETAKKEREERKKAGATPAELGPDPKEPFGYRSKSRPAGLYESMLGVIRPYTARGVIWYQGESNAGMPQYGALNAQLVALFRNDWQRPEWPFFIAQLSTPNANGHPDDAEDYPMIREAQRKVATDTPNAGFVVTLDHGEQGKVHPLVKQPVGERFARLALARVYGQSGFAAQSPSAIAARPDGNAITITFDELPGRIEARDPAIPTLEVQDAASGAWKQAGGEIAADGKSLRVTLPDGMSAAKAVRYGWRNYCVLSLYTDEGLPVGPWNLPVAD